MAMIKCPDCGRQVSAMAETCPECGRPLRMSRKGNAFNPFHDPVHFIGLLIAVGFALLMIVFTIKVTLN